MKKILLPLLALLLMSSDSFLPWKDITHCESPSPISLFASLADFKSFRDIHPLPEKVDYQEEGKMISFRASDGKNAAAYFVKAEKSAAKKYLFVFHEWWGLNDHIKQESDKWAEMLPGVHVIALDLYDGKVATTREEAGDYMQNTKEERAIAIIEGALKFAGPEAEIATIGWCFGGGWSLQSGLIAGKQTVGCVMYYGMPEKSVAKLKKLNSDVLGIFASEDQWINAEVVSDFEKNMNKAGKEVTTKTFDGVHGFANPSNPKYNESAAEEAEKMSYEYLKDKFQIS